MLLQTMLRVHKEEKTCDLGIIPPSPACKRALQTVVDALKGLDGHEVVDLYVAPNSSVISFGSTSSYSDPPDFLEGITVGVQLVFSDGGTSHVVQDTSLYPNGMY